MTLFSAAMTLILVMDPLGNIPVFLATLSHVKPERKKKVILRETFIAFIILTLFLFFGKYILEGMRISQPALSIAGGIILFLIAIRMIFPHDDTVKRSQQLGEPFIVPLAIPLVAGPSTMTVIMLLATQQPERLTLWFFALFIAWAVSAVILVFAENLGRLLGARGIIATERLMGMILTTMAVQMFLTGIQSFFKL